VNLDAILADAQTGTPDPRPAGPFADPAHEARARAWDERVWTMALALGLSQGVELDELPVGDPYFSQSEADDTIRFFTELAAAALKAIEAEQARAAGAAWQWGFRWPEWSDNVDSRWVDSEWQARALVAEVPGRVLVRRIPAGRWEPAPAEGGA
jgi:hypothetical protein